MGRWVAFGPSEDERLGTRWCTERAAESCMHSQIISTLLGTFLFFIWCRREQPARHPIQRSRRSMEPLKPSMSHRRLSPWLPRAHGHARPRPHDATYHPRPSASPRLRKWSRPLQTLCRTLIRVARPAWLLRGVQDAQWRPSTAQRTHLRCALAVTIARRRPEPDNPCSPTTRVGATQCSEQ